MSKKVSSLPSDAEECAAQRRVPLSGLSAPTARMFYTHYTWMLCIAGYGYMGNEPQSDGRVKRVYKQYDKQKSRGLRGERIALRIDRLGGKVHLEQCVAALACVVNGRSPVEWPVVKLERFSKKMRPHRGRSRRLRRW